jgi:hypothetical protein
MALVHVVKVACHQFSATHYKLIFFLLIIALVRK